MVNEPPPIPYTAASLFLKFLKSQKMLITEIMPWHPLTTAVQCNITGYLCPLKYSACSLSLAQKTPLLTPILRYTVRCRLHNIPQLLSKFHSQVWMWRLERQYHHSKTGIIFRYRQLASELMSYLHWYPYEGLGMDTMPRNRAQCRRTLNPNILQHYACGRSMCHFILNVNDCSKGKMKMHLLKKVGFVITKRFSIH